jgi:serine/threonine protein kinase
VYLDLMLPRPGGVKKDVGDPPPSRRRLPRFIHEARAASALNHPNIVTIYEIESASGIDFIVMEYVPGETLNRLIPPRGTSLKEVLRIAIPIANALARAHRQGIVHRDVKPANVVVGRDGMVKVLDFGLAKLVFPATMGPNDETFSAGDASPLSRSGTIVGTVGYMSPEQATGRGADRCGAPSSSLSGCLRRRRRARHQEHRPVTGHNGPGEPCSGGARRRPPLWSRYGAGPSR